MASPPDSQPSQRVALITGGGRGLGAAIATALSKNGWAVAVVGRDKTSLDETATRLRQLGSTALAVVADVTDADQVARGVTFAATELGDIDLLINNAGLTTYAPLAESDPAQWWRVVEVNLLGSYLCARAVLPSMLARRSGRIVNVASTAADRPSEDQTAYSVSKAGLVRLTDALAAETEAASVYVFAISPGRVRSDMGVAHATRRGDEGEAHWTPMSATTDLILRIADGELDRLTGRFIHVSDDVDAMRDRAKEIGESDLYQLRVQKL